MINVYDDFHEVFEYEEDTRSYDVRYVAEIQHTGLKSFKRIKDLDEYSLYLKVRAQFDIWDRQWEKIEERTNSKLDKEIKVQKCKEENENIKKIFFEAENLLQQTLLIDDKVNFEELKDNSIFKVENPRVHEKTELESIEKPEDLILEKDPIKPEFNENNLNLNFFESIIPYLKRKKRVKVEEEFKNKLKNWEIGIVKIKEINSNKIESHKKKLDLYNYELNKIRSKFNNLEEIWKNEQISFKERQISFNKKIDELENNYMNSDFKSILKYNQMVLSRSKYPEYITKSFEIEYFQESKTLKIKYNLPQIEDIPKVNEIKYISSKDEFKESLLTDINLFKLYEKIITQICLRSIHEVFEADKINSIEEVIFNGWIEKVNRINGKLLNENIISIHSNKKEFMSIEFERVDILLCFRNLKGLINVKTNEINSVDAK